MRKTLEGDLKAKTLIENYEGLPEGYKDQFAILYLFDDAAPTLKLTPLAEKLYRFLITRTQINDWDKKSLALVWYSNIELAHKLGTCVKSIKRALQNLRQHALIGFKDSPSRQRRGKRDKNDNIVLDKTFGIVMNPIAGMVSELKQRIENYQLTHKRKKAIRKSRTILKGNYGDLHGHIKLYLKAAKAKKLDKLVMKLRDISKYSKDINTQERAIRAMNRAINNARKALSHIAAFIAALEGFKSHVKINKTPQGGQNDPSIINITRRTPLLCNGLTDKGVGESETQNTRRGAISRQLEKIKALKDEAEITAIANQAKPSFKQVRTSLPNHLQKLMREDYGYYELWDIMEIQAVIHGIDEKLLSYSRKMLGLERACAVMSIIIEKYPTLKAPSKYFTSLINRNSTNDLNIDSALFGIIDRRMNGKAHDDIARKSGQLVLAIE